MVTNTKIYGPLGAIVALSLLAACGGGGGSVSNGGGGGGGGNPSPTPTAALTGNTQFATGGTFATGYTYSVGGSGDQVVFSCGCTAQAGTSTTGGGGSFTLVQNSPATPSAPNPTYTIVPGRNYLVVAQGAGSQAWSMQFAGKIPAHNLFLSASNTNDVFTAAVSLYIYENSTSSATAFDVYNFNTLKSWYTHLTSSPNAAETKLLNDIASQSAAAQPLFPTAPGWDKSEPTNATIKADLGAVKTSGDPNLPTPCPGGEGACTGTPTP